MSKKVMTVLGPIDPEALGITYVHEHLFVDMYSPHKNPVYIDNVLDDVDLIVKELEPFQQAGGRTIVEVTNQSLGRDPLALKQIAERTGINVVAATGYYTEVYYTPSVHEKSIEELTETMICDISEGIDDSGVRAGIIGEIGTIGQTISPLEEKVFRAAARAQRATGVALTTHTRLGNLAQEQLDIIEDEGVDLQRVMIGHQDAKWNQPAYLEATLRRGAYVAFDCVGREHWSPTLNVPLPTNADRVQAIRYLIDRGYVTQIVLSSDICKKPHLCQYGGWGYGHLLNEFVPLLEQAAVGREAIQLMLVDNPKRVLSE